MYSNDEIILPEAGEKNKFFYMTYANYALNFFSFFFFSLSALFVVLYVFVDNIKVLSIIHPLYDAVFQDYLFFTIELDPLRFNGKQISGFAACWIIQLELFCLGHLIIPIYWSIIIFLGFWGHGKIVIMKQLKGNERRETIWLFGLALFFPGILIFSFDGYFFYTMSDDPNFKLIPLNLILPVITSIYFCLHFAGCFPGFRKLFFLYVTRCKNQKILIGKASLNHIEKGN